MYSSVSHLCTQHKVPGTCRNHLQLFYPSCRPPCRLYNIPIRSSRNIEIQVSTTSDEWLHTLCISQHLLLLHYLRMQRSWGRMAGRSSSYFHWLSSLLGTQPYIKHMHLCWRLWLMSSQHMLCWIIEQFQVHSSASQLLPFEPKYMLLLPVDTVPNSICHSLFIPFVFGYASIWHFCLDFYISLLPIVCTYR
jgi:hypothetical protein